MIVDHATVVEEAIEQIDALASYQRRAFCEHAAHREISLPQLHLLINLRERGTLTVSELSELLGVTPPSASAIIDRMEERGWVTRERDTVDRRVVHIVLEEHGRTIIDELAGTKRDTLYRLLTVMDDEELGHVIAAIQAAQRAFERLSAVSESD
jgi:MarR family transcriptional regulator, organic hydroperoxide resistance regulator